MGIFLSNPPRPSSDDQQLALPKLCFSPSFNGGPRLRFTNSMNSRAALRYLYFIVHSPPASHMHQMRGFFMSDLFQVSFNMMPAKATHHKQ
jgi:hypothetical protein